MQKHSPAHIRMGQNGELAAIRYLKRKGFDILGHDLKLRQAEIDILARDGASFVLVEVKTSRNRPDSDSHPGSNYSDEQKIRQRRAAKELQKQFPDAEFPFRHDLIEVFMGRFFPVRILHHVDYYRYHTNKTDHGFFSN